MTEVADQLPDLEPDEWARLSKFAAKQAGPDALKAYRREILSVLVGGAAGGAALAVGTGEVEAAASTSDSDGNVGLPSDRVDVFADGIDINTINGDEPVRSQSTEYQIQKDGSDGSGIINFKTS